MAKMTIRRWMLVYAAGMLAFYESYAQRTTTISALNNFVFNYLGLVVVCAVYFHWRDSRKEKQLTND